MQKQSLINSALLACLVKTELLNFNVFATVCKHGSILLQ